MNKQILKALLKEMLLSEEISLEVGFESESEWDGSHHRLHRVRVKFLIDNEAVAEASDYIYIKE